MFLVLPKEKINILALPQVKIGRLDSWFVEKNKRGIITYSMLGTIGLCVAAYLVAVYFSFSIGFEIRKNSEQAMKLTETVSGLELNTHYSDSRFLNENKEFLRSFEKVSSIKYLTPTGGVAYDNR